MKTSRAFTLIELLIVIAIIGVLMGLLFPAVNGVMLTAQKTQARNDAVQIVNAIKAFELEYSRLPSTNSGDFSDEMGGELLEALVGSNDDLNPRKIIFIETVPWKKGKGGLTNDVWKDPWGNSFQVAMDSDYDNRVEVSTNGTSTGSTEIVKKVAVWNVSTNTKQLIRSWD